MNPETRLIYLSLAPGLEEVEPGKLKGICPLCYEDSFMVGLSGPGGAEAFCCLACGVDGDVDTFIRLVKGLPPAETEDIPAEELTPEKPEETTSEGPLQFGGIDDQGLAKDEAEEEIEEEIEKRETVDEGIKVSSNLTMLEEILPFLTLDLPARELQILLYLQFRGCGISAKEVSKKLRIPEKNVHRYLAGLEKRGLIYSGGRPRSFLRIEDEQSLRRFSRKPDPQNRG